MSGDRLQPLLKSAVASTGCQRQNNAAHRRLPSFRAWAFLRAEARGCHTPHRRFRLLTGSWAMLGARYRSVGHHPTPLPKSGKITPAGAQPGRRHCSARSRRAESRSIRRRSWAPTIQVRHRVLTQIVSLSQHRLCFRQNSTVVTSTISARRIAGVESVEIEDHGSVDGTHRGRRATAQADDVPPAGGDAWPGDTAASASAA